MLHLFRAVEGVESGILALMVDETVNRASLRQQTLTALSAPEAKVVALSEALTPSIVIHDDCCDIRLDVGLTHEILFVMKTDSEVTLTQLIVEAFFVSDLGLAPLTHQ